MSKHNALQTTFVIPNLLQPQVSCIATTIALLFAIFFEQAHIKFLWLWSSLQRQISKPKLLLVILGRPNQVISNCPTQLCNTVSVFVFVNESVELTLSSSSVISVTLTVTLRKLPPVPETTRFNF